VIVLGGVRDAVLTDEALRLAAALHHLPEPDVRPAPANWRVASVPQELRERRVELVVPAHDPLELQAALASGTDALVLDLDDTFSPTWPNVLAAHRAVRDVGVPFEGVLMLRPRGLHLVEGHAWVEGAPANAGLFDLAVSVTSLAPRLRAGRHAYLYLPKIASVRDAALWHAAITCAERALRLPAGCVRVGIQIETFPAALEADAILGALRERAFGLNAGRWDYFFSLVKYRPDLLLPERSRMHMGLPYLSAYARLLVQVAARRGAQAVGGTAAMVPDRANPQPVLDRVREDKELEARLGFVAAWAGHASLVPLVREVFAQPRAVSAGATVAEADLVSVEPPAFVSVQGVRDTAALAVTYFREWRRGNGNLELAGRLEDTATVEFARAQLWQWVRHEVPLDDGTRLTRERYRHLRPDGEEGALLDSLVLRDAMPDFFARHLYPLLLEEAGVPSEVILET